MNPAKIFFAIVFAVVMLMVLDVLFCGCVFFDYSMADIIAG